MLTRQTYFIVLFILLAAIGGALVIFATQPSAPLAQQCTAEAKICPDGSAVGRTGPDCSFAECPVTTPAPISDLLSYTDTQRGVSFSYPKDLGTQYIHPQAWPPIISTKKGPLTCKSQSPSTPPVNTTESRTIAGMDFCVTTQSEGAAGSEYTTYNYATEINGQVTTLTAVLQAVRCENYDNPKKTACEQERAVFNMDTIMAPIAESIILRKK